MLELDHYLRPAAMKYNTFNFPFAVSLHLIFNVQTCSKAELAISAHLRASPFPDHAARSSTPTVMISTTNQKKPFKTIGECLSEQVCSMCPDFGTKWQAANTTPFKCCLFQSILPSFWWGGSLHFRGEAWWLQRFFWAAHDILELNFDCFIYKTYSEYFTTINNDIYSECKEFYV